ncbi:Replication protein [Cooperia oncophora]
MKNNPTAEQKRKLKGANFCDVRWCPMCAWRKQRKFAGEPEYFSGKGYITQARWSELWQRCLRADYIPVVDVRKIKPKSAEWTARDSAIFETLKYLAKPQDIRSLCQKDFEELDRQTKGTKQYTQGGVLKDFKPEESEDFSPEEWKLIAEEFYQWLGKNYKQF